MKFHLIESGFLKHPQQNNPCYRKIICYPYFRYIKENNLEKGHVEFEQLFTHVKENKIYILDNYFEFYPTIMTNDGERGYLVVEPSRSYYPLVFYPNSHSQLGNKENPARTSAFITAIDKVHKNRIKIFDLLNEHSDWSFQLEHELEKYFEYKPKQHSNDKKFNHSRSKTG